MQYRHITSIVLSILALAVGGAYAREISPGTWATVSRKSEVLVARTNNNKKTTFKVVSDSGELMEKTTSLDTVVDAVISSSGRFVYVAEQSKKHCTTLEINEVADTSRPEMITLPGKACIDKLFATHNDGVAVVDASGNVTLIDTKKGKKTCKFQASAGTKGGGLFSLVDSPDGKWLAGVNLSGALRDPSDADEVLLCNTESGKLSSLPLPRALDGASLLWISPTQLMEISRAQARLFDTSFKNHVAVKGPKSMNFSDWVIGASGQVFAASRGRAGIFSINANEIKQQASVKDKKYNYLASDTGVIRLSEIDGKTILVEWLSTDLRNAIKQQRVSFD